MQAFIEHMDQSGGIYYHRWGDAELHTLTVALFMPGALEFVSLIRMSVALMMSQDPVLVSNSFELPHTYINALRV